MTGEDPLLWEKRDGYTFATLSRPASRNAINGEVIGKIHALCADLEREPQPLVFTGAGGIFAAGADIRELRDRRPEQALNGINSRAFERIAQLPMPTIAIVDGAAVGGGAELAYAFDLRIATPTTFFSNPEPGLGIIAGAGAGWRLRQLVGPSVARQVLLAGKRLTAEDALRFGLVLEIVESANAEVAAVKLVTRMAAWSANAVRLTKLVLLAPDEAHPMVDDTAQAVLFGSEDAVQRMTSFLEKK
jgi:enoyl-CoA hydratase/carnithine racemase